MTTEVSSGAVVGIDGYEVHVEVDLVRGLPSFTIVGLPNASVRESRERVCASIRNYGFRVPQKRITISLAPADVRKIGAAFDLPIAIAILLASEQTRGDNIFDSLFLGELTLDGRLKPVRGILPIACHAKKKGYKYLVLPDENGREASFVSGIDIVCCRDLGDVLKFLDGTAKRKPGKGPEKICLKDHPLDFDQVTGQSVAKRALQIAAAGGHHLLMIGPPGSGKTMLIKRISSILPPMEDDEALESAKILSVIEGPGCRAVDYERPFRAPHHSASDAGLIGGGRNALPGEITRAHNGILFLDELTEFRRNVLETLRQPIEEGTVLISRANAALRYPARFQLIAAMNPCPCGYFGSADHRCSCSEIQVKRYLSKISGPLLDRIAIHLSVMAVPSGDLSAEDGEKNTGSGQLKKGVLAAVEFQRNRYAKDDHLKRNADLEIDEVKKYCRMEGPAEIFLFQAQKKLIFSMRTRKNIIQVARTIADLDQADLIRTHHIAEAVQYRSLKFFSGTLTGRA
ncbi:MAG: YifB family Mg chelatase-like AAA ATPase [Candidatus Krumholzibacteriota bacterium]|nr:YifB family Mg chelatase-like AAA ATPase [Candidatus Krumholzibacteriota bacterium]